MNKKLAFIGLGVMGFPMAGHLAKAGHQVCVYNRTTEKAKLWQESYAGQIALSPKEAAQKADIIFVCVGNDDDLRQIMLSKEGVIAGLEKNKIVVDHTTTSAIAAREMAEACESVGAIFYDAPVSGGQAGAENGQLTIMMGGSESYLAEVSAVMQAYARFSRLLGPIGSGQLAKMMNQICIAGIVQGLAEALHFGKNAGLDCSTVIEVISKGAAQSWQMENRSNTMLQEQYDFGFAVDWMRKDLAIVLEEAKQNGSTLPLTALVDQFYVDVQKMGGNRWDTSSLLARLNR